MYDKTKLYNIEQQKKIKSSKKAMKWLDELAKQNGCNIQRGDINGVGEYCFKRTNGRKYYFDGYCSETNTVYEFHGCMYHQCVECNGNPNHKKYVETMKREKEIVNAGFRLFRIWEHEWEKYTKGTTNIIGNYINN